MSATAWPSPGIHLRVPFEEYLQTPVMSQSTLKHGRDSMLHLKCAIDGVSRTEPTDEMTLGSALHTAFLEPGLFNDRVALWTGPRRAGPEWEAFQAEHYGYAILTPGYHKKLLGMVAALRRHPEVKRWTDRTSAVEVSCIGELHGIPFRGRIDAMTDDPLWDLKKISSTDERTITASINNFGYAIQAYCYRKLFGRDRFCFAFVEDKPPHDVRVVELSPAWLHIGEQETLMLIQRYQWCMEHNLWPGRSDQVEVIEPPEWLSNRYSEVDDITLDGEQAFEEAA